MGGWAWRREPDESRVGIERLAARWPIPERIEANREAAGKVGVWIRKVWIGGGEHVAGDHLLKLLLALLLLQVHGNGESKGVERTDFSQEAERPAKGAIWNLEGEGGWPAERWIVCSCSDVEVEVRHGCLRHHEGGRGSADVMGDRGMVHPGNNTWHLARNGSRVDIASERL